MKINCVIISNIIVSLMLDGCNPQENHNKLVKRWYYENGNIRKVQEYIINHLNDTIEHGLYLYHNEDGVLIDSAMIINNEFHGKRFIYYNNGNINKITTYKNDVYRSGLNFDFEGYLKNYSAYNYARDLMFLVEFDSTGSVKKYNGKPIYSWVLEERYAVGDTISFELLVPNIPDFKTEVRIIDGVKSYQEYYPDEFNRVKYRGERITSDKQEFVNLLEVRNSDNKIVMTDTLIFEISETGETSYR